MNILPSDYQCKPNALYTEKVDKHSCVDWEAIRKAISGEITFDEVMEAEVNRMEEQIGVLMLLSLFDELS